MASNPFDVFDAPIPSNGFSPVGGPAPDFQYKAPKAAADVNSTLAGTARTQVQTDADRATLPYAAPKAAADVARAQAEAQKASLDAQAAAPAAATKPNPQAARIQQQLQTDDVLAQIDRARTLIHGGTATGITGSILGHLPGTNATDLSGTLSTIGSNVTQGVLQNLKSQSATGASGFGALSDSEGKLLRDSIASLGQNQSDQQLLENLSRVERHYRNATAIQNNEDPRDAKVAAKYGIILPNANAAIGGGNAPPGSPPPPPGGTGGLGDAPLGLSPGGTQTVADPTLKGVNTHVRSMVGAGASADGIKSYLNEISPGLGDQMSGDIAKQVAFRKQNPAVPLSQYQISLETKDVPLSKAAQNVNAIGQSALGAGAIGAADMASGGYLDNLTSNPALTRAAMSAVAQQHPLANAIGGLAGGAAAGASFEAGLGRAGLSAAARLPAADALYGSFYGSGSDDDNRLAGAGTGAAVGALGGAVGRKALGMFGRGVAGIQDQGLTTLRDAGVPMTTGQVIGGATKGIEDRLAGLLLVGDAINARRRAGLQQVQRAAFDEALSGIPGSTDGAIGEQGVGRALNKVSDAYKQALGGVNVSVDHPYRQAMGQMQPAIAAIPRVGPELHAALNATVAPMFNGTNLSGSSMQAVDRGLQQLKSGYRNDPLYATHIAPAIDGVGDQVSGLFERQAPQVMPAYSAAKDAFRHVSTLEDAVLAGKNTGGEFTPAQLGTASVANARKFGGKHLAASEDRPFFDLQRAAQDNLPSKVPDSGTAGRLVIPGVAAALGGGFGAGASDADSRKGNAALGALTLGALASAPYSKAAQAAITRSLLLERPDALVKLGNAAVNGRRLGGMFGNPLALQYYVAPGQ